MEAVILVDVLRRAGVDVDLAGLVAGPCVGSRGIVIEPDGELGDQAEDGFDMIVLPGGGPGTAALRADLRVVDLLRRFAAAGKVTAAICAAPTVLLDAGLLAGRSATCHPAVADELRAAGVSLRDQRVVADGTVITSQSPGTTFEFAYCLVDLLCGSGTSTTLNRGILARV